MSLEAVGDETSKAHACNKYACSMHNESVPLQLNYKVNTGVQWPSEDTTTTTTTTVFNNILQVPCTDI